MPILVFGQPNYTPDPGDTGGGAAPIDGGLSILLAAGVGYVVKKGRDAQKKKRETNILEK